MAEIPVFNSIEEARAAGLPKGTPVDIVVKEEQAAKVPVFNSIEEARAAGLPKGTPVDIIEGGDPLKIDNPGSLDIYMQPPSDNRNFFGQLAFTTGEIVKSVGAASFSAAEKTSGVLSMLGETMKSNNEDFQEDWYGNWSDATPEQKKREVKEYNAIPDNLIKWGENLEDFWTDPKMVGWTEPDPELAKGTILTNPSFTKLASEVAGGLVILGTAGAISVATKNPSAGLAYMGVLSTVEKYDEGMEADLSSKESAKLGALSFVGTIALMAIPFGRWLKGGSGVLTKDLFMSGAQMGLAMPMFTLWSNLITKYGIDDTRNLFEGLLESAILGVATGMLLGGITSRKVKSNLDKINKLKEKGFTEKELDMATESIGYQVTEVSETLNAELLKARDVLNKKLREKGTVPEKESFKVDATKKTLENKIKEKPKTEKKSLKKEIKADLKSKDKYLKSLQEKLKQAKDVEDIYEAQRDILKEIKKTRTKENPIVDSETFKSLEAEVANLRELITPIKTRRISKSIQDKMNSYLYGKDVGTAEGMKTLRGLQKEVIGLLKGKDYSKKLLTRINKLTPDSFVEQFSEIMSRIEKYETKIAKDNLIKNIDKTLKSGKPIVSGKRVKGKFTYTSSKLFSELIKINKMTKAQALKALNELSIENNMDLIKARLLNMKAAGKELTSVQMYNRILKDLNNLKEASMEAMHEAAFEDNLKKIRDIQEFRAGFDKLKINERGLFAKGIKGFLKVFGNTYDTLNAFFGKKIAEKYYPEFMEQKKFAAYQKSYETIIKRAQDIFNMSERKAGNKIIDMGGETINFYDKTGRRHLVSKFHIVDMYLSMKNEKSFKNYDHFFGAENIEALINEHLSSSEVRFADAMQAQVQDYLPILNQRNILVNGRDLNIVDSYWMRSSEGKINLFDAFRKSTEQATAMQERAKGLVEPKFDNAWRKFDRYIKQANHIEYMSPVFDKLNNIIRDSKLRGSIQQKLGNDAYSFLINEINEMSLNAHTKKLNAVTNIAGDIINNWVVAKIGINPGVFVKQLMSITNYMENMPVKDWTAGFMRGTSHPVETIKYMLDNSPYLKARFKRGMTERLNQVMDSVNKSKGLKSDWVKAMTITARIGDIGAIIFGGYPVVEYAMRAKSKGGLGMSKKAAFDMFIKQTISSQQSSLSTGLSRAQNDSSGLNKILFAFRNTTTQYLRKNVDALISHKRGEMTTGQAAKVITLYGVVQPVLYSLAGSAVKDTLYNRFQENKGAEAMQDMFLQLAVSPVSAVPFLDNILKNFVKAYFGDKDYTHKFGEPVLDDVQNAIQSAYSVFMDVSEGDEPEAEDVFNVIKTGLELGLAVPVDTPKRLIDNVTGVNE